MSELKSMRSRGERHGEAKYNYLANFPTNEFNSLRENRNYESYSNNSRPIERRSPVGNSNERRSRLRPVLHEYSPSCSTFNPHQQGQEQFSPYNERQHREEIKIGTELVQQNAALKSKLAQSEQTIQTLSAELAKRDAEILKIKTKEKSDLISFEKTVGDMASQIQSVLTQNKMLEDQLGVARVKLQEQFKRQDQRREEDLKRIEEGRRDAQNRKSTADRSSDKPLQKIEQNQKQNMKDHKNRGVDESTHRKLNSTSVNIQEIAVANSELDKQTRRSQEFISSIKAMQTKITGQQPCSSLKQLWKWLKGIGHTHSCLKKWKAKAAAVHSYPATSDKLKEVIREACSYIQ